MADELPDNKAPLSEGEQSSDPIFERRLAAAKGLSAAEAGGNPAGQTGDVAAGEAGAAKPKDWRLKLTENFGKAKLGPKTILKSKPASIIGILLVLIGVPIGGISFLAPTLLFEQVKNVLVDGLDDSTAARTIRGNKVIMKKVDGVKNAFTESTPGKCNIKCRFGSVSNGFIKKMERAGFVVETENRLGRSVIKSIIFPDGLKVTDGDGFDKALDNNSRAAAMLRVVDFKVAPFLSSRVVALFQSRGLNKNPKLAGATESEVRKAQRQSLGLPGDSAAEDPLNGVTDQDQILKDARYAKLSAAVSSVSSKLGRGTNVLALSCSAYDVARGITFAEKAMKLSTMRSFAMGMLTGFDQTLVGDGSPALSSALGATITETVDGKAGTDALAYGMLAHGNTGELSDLDMKYAASPLGTAAGAASLTSWVGADNAAFGVATPGCKAAYSPAGNVVSCLPEIVSAIASAAGTAGVGVAVSAAVCIGKEVAIDTALQLAVNTFMTTVVSDTIKGGLPDINETTRGTPVGSALVVGSASEIFNPVSANLGLRPGTTEEIRTYNKVSLEVKNEQETIARSEAAKTPLDVSNQYSFLGQFVRSLGVANMYNSDVSSTVSTVASIIPRSLAAVTGQGVSAASDEKKVEKKADRFEKMKCKDPNIEILKYAADGFCNLSYIMTGDELNMDIDTAIDYMINTGNIDIETGKQKSNSNYERYVKYCSERVDPMGETSASISEDDYGWRIGSECGVDNEERRMFRVYTMDYATNEMLDEDDSDTTSFAMFYQPGDNDANSSIASTQELVGSNVFTSIGQSLQRLLGATTGSGLTSSAGVVGGSK